MHHFEQRKKNSWLKVLMRILPLSPTAWGLLVMTIVLEQSVVADNDNLFLGAVVSFLWFVGATTWLFTIVIYWLIKRKLDNIAFSLSTDRLFRNEWSLLNTDPNLFKPYFLTELRIKSDEQTRYQVVNAQRSEGVRLRFLRRGEYQQLHLSFIVADIFGLFRMQFEHTANCLIRVLPQTSQLEVETLRLPSDGGDSENPHGRPDGDPIEMRRYAPGDPHRMILWKAYARTRKLLVRTPEKAESDENATAVLLLSCEDDHAAADVVQYLIKRRGENVLFAAVGIEAVAFDTHSALDLLTRSGNVEQYSLTALLTFLKSHHPQHLKRVVVVGAASDQDFAFKIDQLNSFLTSEVHVVVAAAETHQRSRSWQEEWGVIEIQDAESDYPQLAQRAKEFRARQQTFEIANPTTGKRFDGGLWT